MLVSITADIGSVAVISEGAADGNVSQHLALVRPISSACDTDWLAYAIKSPASKQQLLSKSYGGTKVGLGLYDIAELRLPRLPVNQQRYAAKKIRDALSETETVREAIVKQVRILAERRQALITAAVTGQIDVTTARGVTA